MQMSAPLNLPNRRWSLYFHRSARSADPPIRLSADGASTQFRTRPVRDVVICCARVLIVAGTTRTTCTSATLCSCHKIPRCFAVKHDIYIGSSLHLFVSDCYDPFIDFHLAAVRAPLFFFLKLSDEQSSGVQRFRNFQNIARHLATEGAVNGWRVLFTRDRSFRDRRTTEGLFR
jgi:hypothetical protein